MDWSPEEQRLIECFEVLDKVSHSIAAYMLSDKLPLQTVSKLLPLAELACRNKDPSGALVFSGIETPFPCVKYYANAGRLTVALLRHRSNHYVLPLRPVFEIAMRRSSESTLRWQIALGQRQKREPCALNAISPLGDSRGREHGRYVQPSIIALCCNWCAYAGADLAGVSRTQYPPSIRIIRVMCSGMVHPNLVIDALTKGADGVLICGCHHGDCHYQEGNYKTEKRAEAIRLMLADFGIEEERFRLEWVSAAEGPRFAQVVREFTEQVQKLGVSPYRS